MLASGDGPFPTDPQQALDYLDTLWEGAAPRTAYKDFGSALDFFEAAGERPEAERIGFEQSVKNAIVSLTARRAQLVSQLARESPKGKQAPPLLVSQVVALERLVTCAKCPLYQRFYAWTKLLRHWCSLRWDDTNGLVPSEL